MHIPAISDGTISLTLPDYFAKLLDIFAIHQNKPEITIKLIITNTIVQIFYFFIDTPNFHRAQTQNTTIGLNIMQKNRD